MFAMAVSSSTDMATTLKELIGSRFRSTQDAEAALKAEREKLTEAQNARRAIIAHWAALKTDYEALELRIETAKLQMVELKNAIEAKEEEWVDNFVGDHEHLSDWVPAQLAGVNATNAEMTNRLGAVYRATESLDSMHRALELSARWLAQARLKLSDLAARKSAFYQQHQNDIDE
jgi:DNA repair exonuclease SbcCD ATPase subunit